MFLLTWLNSAKLKLLGALGALVTLLLVYFVGRKNSKGDINLAVAQKELNQVQQQHAKTQEKLDALHTRQTDIIADILQVETERITKEAGNRELTDDEVVERLHIDGLLK